MLIDVEMGPKSYKQFNSYVSVNLVIRWPTTMFGTNISTTFTQWCLNIAVEPDHNIGRRCSNIYMTFSEHCNLVSLLGTRVDTTMWQHCHNVVIVWKLWLKYNIDTTLPQHFFDIHTTLLGHLKASANECCHNLPTTFAWKLLQHCHNFLALARCKLVHVYV